MPSKGSRSSSKKAKKSGSSVFDFFTQKQVAEFKEGFQIMDHDRDGIIGKNDLRATFNEIGRLCTDNELEEMLAEGEDNINFTKFLHMFSQKSSGEVDEDDIVADAFRKFDKVPGLIDSENFRTMLMAFGTKFTSKEVDEAFNEMEMDDDGMINSEALIAMLTASGPNEPTEAE